MKQIRKNCLLQNLSANKMHSSCNCLNNSWFWAELFSGKRLYLFWGNLELGIITDSPSRWRSYLLCLLCNRVQSEHDADKIFPPCGKSSSCDFFLFHKRAETKCRCSSQIVCRCVDNGNFSLFTAPCSHHKVETISFACVSTSRVNDGLHGQQQTWKLNKTR